MGDGTEGTVSKVIPPNLAWAREQVYGMLTRIDTIASTNDVRTAVYQTEELLADLNRVTIIGTIFRDLAVKALRREEGLDK